MTRSPDSLVPSADGQPSVEKRDDKASNCRQGGEANPRAATQVNAVSASSTPPASRPTQLELFPGRACPLKAKPVTGRESPQGGVISPLLSNAMLHELDRQWCNAQGQFVGAARLVRYADEMVLLAKSEQEARAAWDRLQAQFAALRLFFNQYKSRITTVAHGFTFLGFDFRWTHGCLYLWPCSKARKHITQRVRQTVRSFRSSERLDVVVRKLNPVLNGWCATPFLQQHDGFRFRPAALAPGRSEVLCDRARTG
jgi:hypothetical protein